MDVTRKRHWNPDIGVESEILESLSRPISPPRKRKRAVQMMKSPWQLTRIRDLPPEVNKDAVTLQDVLGDPLIYECWQFNFLHSIPFILDAFDPSVRHTVQLHIVHGFWERNDLCRIILAEDAAQNPNVRLHCAPMPEMFGTHHSKLMVLFRTDNTVQVIIHTANMIEKDWTNMTNAIWSSPKLPRLQQPDTILQPGRVLPIGSGARFKLDLLTYLTNYDTHSVICRPLLERLMAFDFSGVRAALIASVPGKHYFVEEHKPAWGWAGLQKCLQAVPVEHGQSEIVVQVSSIATLGAKSDWLQKTLFDSLAMSRTQNPHKPNFKVIFPTADEVRNSLDGYAAGHSIHIKIKSAQHIRQLHYLQPMLHHWGNDCVNGAELPEAAPIRGDSGRNRAAPHIKTYVRYNQNNSIDWALLTSANVSKQAWGEALRSTSGEVRIASWELGVMVWPGLLSDDGVMVSSFQSDTLDASPFAESQQTLIGLRMPYSMPLQAYGSDEVPWAPTVAHHEPDWKGYMWMYPSENA